MRNYNDVLIVQLPELLLSSKLNKQLLNIVSKLIFLEMGQVLLLMFK